MKKMVHPNHKGQALTETALIMPIMMMMALVIWQLILIQHARIMVEYAAHCACRTGIVRNADVTYMQNAALIAVLPIYGRTDNLAQTILTYGKMRAILSASNAVDGATGSLTDAVKEMIGVNIGSVMPNTAFVSVEITNPKNEHFWIAGRNVVEIDFDYFNPVEGIINNAQINYLAAEVRVMVPLKIPVVNKAIFQMYVGRNRLGDAFKGKDAFEMVQDIGNGAIRNNVELQFLRLLGAAGAYFLPIHATCGMQMQSNAYRNNVGHGLFDIDAITTEGD